MAVATTQSLVLSEPAWKEKEVPATAGGKKKMETKQASRAPGVRKQRVFQMDDSSSALEEDCQCEYKNLLRRAVRQEKKRLTLLAAQPDINRLARLGLRPLAQTDSSRTVRPHGVNEARKELRVEYPPSPSEETSGEALEPLHADQPVSYTHLTLPTIYSV